MCNLFLFLSSSSNNVLISAVTQIKMKYNFRGENYWKLQTCNLQLEIRWGKNLKYEIRFKEG